MMWLYTLALVLSVAFVCEASVRRDAEADCHQVTRLALKLRDVFKKANKTQKSDFPSKLWYDQQVQAGMISFGVNFNNDEEVEKLFCMLIESEHKTIREIAERRWDQFQMMDETRLSFFFSTVRNYLKHAEIYEKDMRSYYCQNIEFFDKTGFPSTFPSKLSKEDLTKFLSDFDEYTLRSIYHWLTEYDENYNSIVQIEKFATLYSESDSLKEFIRKWMELDSDYHTDSDVEMRFNDTLRQEQDDREQCNKIKDMYNYVIPLTEALESSGFLSVTRGPPLDTCDFITDTAVEAFGYVVELFGSETVQNILTYQLELELQVGDESALRNLVCSIMSIKTRDDLAIVAPKSWIASGLHTKYMQFTLTVMNMMVNPHERLMLGMSLVRVVKATERVGFPNFPLSITKAQAQQLVALMYKPYLSGGNSDWVKTLLDADSMEEAADNFYELAHLKDAVDILGGKTDIALKLVSCLYQVATSAEELGLFMLL